MRVTDLPEPPVAQQLKHLQTLAAAVPVQILHLGETQVAYQDLGQGMPLVLLHGFMANHANWWHLAQALSPHLRCICPDLLGFGQSSQPDIAYDIACQVEFIRRFTQALQISPFVLVGHSFGGWVAASYALNYPADLKGLILLAPAGIRDDSFCGRYDHLKPLLWSTSLVDGFLSLCRPLAKILGREKSLAEIVWLRRALQEQPVARQFLLQRSRPEDAVDTVETQIDQLQVPTLVIAAEQDDTIPLWHCQTYAERIPAAKFRILPEASHQIPVHHWDLVAPLILQFTSTLS
jgi:pimeloyl-ACP methyl ester carboxylesterase